MLIVNKTFDVTSDATLTRFVPFKDNISIKTYLNLIHLKFATLKLG